MSQLKRVYEGPDPSALLNDIMKEHGSSVVISSPALIRKGGVLGFFSTRHFRVEVRPKFDQIGDERQSVNPSKGTQSALESLVEETSDSLQLSTVGSKSFGSVLDDVAGSLGDDPTSYTADNFVSSSNTATASPMSSRRAQVPVNSFDQPTNASDHRFPSTHRGLDPNSSYRRVLDSFPWSASIHAPADSTLVPVPHAATQPAPTSDQLQSRELPTTMQPVDTSVEWIMQCFRDAKFPEELLEATLHENGGGLSFEAAFSGITFAQRLPRTPGTLIAIVGPKDLAQHHGIAIARSLGVHRADVCLAQPKTMADNVDGSTGTVVHDAKQAGVVGPGLRRDRIAIVAIEHPDTRTGDEWTRKLLRAFRPTATWMIADARQKRPDIERLAQAIGGVDALVLDHVERSVTPCEILHGTIPVARLDGKVASPKTWANLVESMKTPDRRTR